MVDFCDGFKVNFVNSGNLRYFFCWWLILVTALRLSPITAFKSDVLTLKDVRVARGITAMLSNATTGALRQSRSTLLSTSSISPQGLGLHFGLWLIFPF